MPQLNISKTPLSSSEVKLKLQQYRITGRVASRRIYNSRGSRHSENYILQSDQDYAQQLKKVLDQKRKQLEKIKLQLSSESSNAVSMESVMLSQATNLSTEFNSSLSDQQRSTRQHRSTQLLLVKARLAAIENACQGARSQQLGSVHSSLNEPLVFVVAASQLAKHVEGLKSAKKQLLIDITEVETNLKKETSRVSNLRLQKSEIRQSKLTSYTNLSAVIERRKKEAAKDLDTVIKYLRYVLENHIAPFASSFITELRRKPFDQFRTNEQDLLLSIEIQKKNVDFDIADSSVIFQRMLLLIEKLLNISITSSSGKKLYVKLPSANDPIASLLNACSTIEYAPSDPLLIRFRQFTRTC